ncbi:helix-turn-helix transcriptional regulator [Pseudomonas aeruginosa]|uniref:S24 family peptidase n=1 Tax=Pseudomonas aeruginosa TaxID=287 RepID=UPI000447054D|nr:S24 family peptidase [Pseudomonas aeruginosa]KAJ17043.1 hypothetical protein M003_30170 [Pseudomonas aeruginosa IGB83]MCW4648158.1 helix-turn-helix transcriptional regulator [Pseudomonas aeruginosa]
MENHIDTSPRARGARFALALQKSGLKGRELAQKLGLENDQNITNWKSRGVPRRYLLDTARELFVTPDWLDTGKMPDPRSTVPLEELELQETRQIREMNMIPVLGKAMLGDSGFFEVMDYPTGSGDGYLHAISADPAAYAVRVVGHSMRPRIKDGEFVVIEPSKTPRPGDEVLIRTHSGRCMVKEYLYYREGTYCLGSVNEEVGNIHINEDDVSVLHPVGGIYKSHMYFPD